MAYTFKPRTWEAEADKHLSSRQDWSTQWVPGQLGYTDKPCLKKTEQVIFTEVCEQCATVHLCEGQSGVKVRVDTGKGEFVQGPGGMFYEYFSELYSAQRKADSNPSVHPQATVETK